MWQKVADLLAALTALVELIRRSQELGMALDERETLVLEQLVGAGLHVMLDERRLVVEEILLGRSARHVQIDDALRLGRKHGGPWRHRVVGGGREILAEFGRSILAAPLVTTEHG